MTRPSTDPADYGVFIVPHPDDEFAVTVRHLTPDENGGNHHLYYDARKPDGTRDMGAGFIVYAMDGSKQWQVVVDKEEGPYNPPGKGGDFPMFKSGVFGIRPNSLKAAAAEGFHTSHPDEPPGPDDGGTNTLFHHSFTYVVDQAAPAVPGDTPTPGPTPEPYPDDIISRLRSIIRDLDGLDGVKVKILVVIEGTVKLLTETLDPG